MENDIMIDKSDVNNTIVKWCNIIENLIKNGRESVYNRDDLSNGLYEWLELKHLLDEMSHYTKRGLHTESSKTL